MATESNNERVLMWSVNALLTVLLLILGLYIKTQEGRIDRIELNQSAMSDRVNLIDRNAVGNVAETNIRVQSLETANNKLNETVQKLFERESR